jgi:DNA-binding MurR/RpiR family transcriptional regulator
MQRERNIEPVTDAGRAPAPALPRDFSALRDLLLARRDSLPKRLAQVATFAIERPGDMAFGTAAEIAAAIDVQPSTLVRFAQSLDYSGFSQLQAVFRDHVRGHWPDYRERLRNLRAGEPASTLLDGFARAAIRSIEHLTTSIPEERLEAAIRLLGGAETIYLIAARRAYPVAAYLSYALGRLGLRHVLIDHTALLGPETIAFATERDAALAISFSPYTPGTVDLAAEAHRKGVPVVAITDSPLSPLVPLARIWLEIVETDHAAFRSLAGTFTLAMALAAGTAECRAARSGA